MVPVAEMYSTLDTRSVFNAQRIAKYKTTEGEKERGPERMERLECMYLYTAIPICNSICIKVKAKSEKV